MTVSFLFHVSTFIMETNCYQVSSKLLSFEFEETKCPAIFTVKSSFKIAIRSCKWLALLGLLWHCAITVRTSISLLMCVACYLQRCEDTINL